MKKGEIYGYLKVISFPRATIDGKKFYTDAVECECLKCGNTTITTRGRLKNGSTKSCGCLRIEKIKELPKSSWNERLTFVEDTCIEIISSDKVYKNNLSSDKRGVSLVVHNGNPRWEARLMCQGHTYKRRFKTFDEAVEQRKKWEEEYFRPLIEKYNNTNETHI